MTGAEFVVAANTVLTRRDPASDRHRARRLRRAARVRSFRDAASIVADVAETAGDAVALAYLDGYADAVATEDMLRLGKHVLPYDEERAAACQRRRHLTVATFRGYADGLRRRATAIKTGGVDA